MRPIALLLSTVLLYYNTQAQEDSEVIVETRLGNVRGVEQQHGQQRVRSYLGVPFAEPPTGSQRFKIPQPKKSWARSSGTINATQLSPACYQGRDGYGDAVGGFWGSDMWNANTPVSEDCLYLNIWAPAGAKNLTVLVWLFGGGFYSGSPSLGLYDGKELATRGNVIVVNINYRVGPFGYLYLGHEDVPGNMGMLDQQLALYWIRDHIFTFGGDPGSITLVGESAGAASIVAHLIAPASRGLFQNGILQSGSLDNRWSMDSPKRALEKSKNLADLVNCNQTEIKSQIECLKNTPAQDLIDQIWNVGLNFLEFPFVITSKDANFFKYFDGFDALRHGNYSTDVNLMFGINHDEGNFWNIYNLPSYFDSVKTEPERQKKPKLSQVDFHECVNTAFAFQPELVRSAAKYIYSNPSCKDPNLKEEFYSEQVNQMVGDYFFTCDSVWLAHNYPKLAEKRGDQSKVFVYYFNQPSSANPWPKWTGVMHGYEIEFVFGVPIYNKTAAYTKAEVNVAEKVIDWWTTFAATGVPTLRNSSLSSKKITWEQYDGVNRTKWLNIQAGAFGMIQEIKKVECDLWRNAKDIEYTNYKIELTTCSSSTLLGLSTVLLYLLDTIV
ncbi:unnamed protein product [Caenorhabditis angaria]|uniref:Carboxylic ester hydrolase n=1 Tax=Caenorhabditis angaria TaxID=860376 RepID=A0A9P1MXU4_9PELO|nr:unnamed protein product [Caenorhabditis angaria]